MQEDIKMLLFCYNIYFFFIFKEYLFFIGLVFVCNSFALANALFFLKSDSE